MTGLSTLASFVDDVIQSAPTVALEWELVAIAACVFRLTCIFEKIQKRVWPAHIQEVLGLIFSTLSGQLSVPGEKRARLLILVREVLAICEVRGAISIEALGSLVGKLQDAAQGFVCAGFFLFELRSPLNTVLHHLRTRRESRAFLVPCVMFPRMKTYLQAWIDCLTSQSGKFQYSLQPNGYWGAWSWNRTFLEGALPSGFFFGATDASKKAGGFTFGGARTVHQWSVKERSFHINILESLIPVYFLQEFGPYVQGQRGVLWMDSAVAIAALNAGKSKNKVIVWAARMFKLLCMRYSVQMFLAHIPTLMNLEADWISRCVLGVRISDWTVSRTLMSTWRLQSRGKFHVDVYSDPAGVNSQASTLCSFTRPPSQFPFLPHHIVWAFPPPSLADNALSSALRWRCHQVFLLVPTVIYEEHTSSSAWVTQHVLKSSEAHFGYFKRMVQGNLGPCKAPGFDMVVLCRKHTVV